MARAGQYMENIGTGKVIPALAGMGGLANAATLAVTGHPGLAAFEAIPIGAAKTYTSLSGSPGGKAWMLKVAPRGIPSAPTMPVGPLVSGASAINASIHRPTSQEEYDAIPSGEPYQSVSGAMGVKP